MDSGLLQRLADKSVTKEQLLQDAKGNAGLIPELLKGTSSSRASIRYGCAKVLMDLSKERPDMLYPHMEFFMDLLGSRYRILTWNALAIIANLARVDKDMKFDAIFGKYYGFLNDEYMVTVANVVGHSGKIALAKPHLIQKIADELLKVGNIPTTPHLTEECKRVIAGKAISYFSLFFDKIDAKEKVASFVRRHLNSPRRTLSKEAEDFLNEWGQLQRK